MDQTESEKQQSLGQFMKYRFHGKFTQLVLSLSIFSLLFSHSYWLSLLHCFCFNLHDTLPFQLFSHNIDKNFMFLLCNGLLVFLAKFSKLISSSNDNNHSVLDDDNDQSFKCFEDVPQSNQSLLLEPQAPLLQKYEALRNSTVMEETHEEDQEEDGEKWGLNNLMKNNEELENGVLVEDDEDLKELGTENYDRHRVLSTDDELNKRFDEFIRKMKEEMRIEARHQLVMV